MVTLKHRLLVVRGRRYCLQPVGYPGFSTENRREWHNKLSSKGVDEVFPVLHCPITKIIDNILFFIFEKLIVLSDVLYTMQEGYQMFSSSKLQEQKFAKSGTGTKLAS